MDKYWVGQIWQVGDTFYTVSQVGNGGVYDTEGGYWPANMMSSNCGLVGYQDPETGVRYMIGDTVTFHNGSYRSYNVVRITEGGFIDESGAFIAFWEWMRNWNHTVHNGDKDETMVTMQVDPEPKMSRSDEIRMKLAKLEADRAAKSPTVGWDPYGEDL